MRFKPTSVGDTQRGHGANHLPLRFKPTDVGDTSLSGFVELDEQRFKPTSVGDTEIGGSCGLCGLRFKPTDVGDTFGPHYLYQKQKATGNPIALIISQVSDQSSHAIYVKP